MATITKEVSQMADQDQNPLIGLAQSHIVSLTDSTTGTAGDTVNDTTASVKDDIASLAAKINAIILVLEAHGLVKSS